MTNMIKMTSLRRLTLTLSLDDELDTLNWRSSSFGNGSRHTT